MERFIIFEYHLNNFWVIKSKEYFQRFAKMSGFFCYRLFSAQGQFVHLALYECCVTLK